MIHPVVLLLYFVFSYQLALSASTPIYRGLLSDRDCRWSVIEQSVDDRTLEERGLAVRTLSRHFLLRCYSRLCGVTVEARHFPVLMPLLVLTFCADVGTILSLEQHTLL